MLLICGDFQVGGFGYFALDDIRCFAIINVLFLSSGFLFFKLKKKVHSKHVRYGLACLSGEISKIGHVPRILRRSKKGTLSHHFRWREPRSEQLSLGTVRFQLSLSEKLLFFTLKNLAPPSILIRPVPSYHGGWICPNIYFLGFAGVVNFGGLRIGGISGIHKPHHFNMGKCTYLFDDVFKKWNLPSQP